MTLLLEIGNGPRSLEADRADLSERFECLLDVREASLAADCTGELDLRREIESLLSARENAGILIPDRPSAAKCPVCDDGEVFRPAGPPDRGFFFVEAASPKPSAW